MTPRFKPNQRVKLGTVIFSITILDFFGPTQHYGITWTEDGIKYHSGWIPVLIFDALATGVKS